MAGITDIGATLSQQYTLKILRQQLTEAQQQTSTGKKSQTLAGLGPAGASTSISLRGKFNAIDVYKQNLYAAKTQFQIMDASINVVNENARELLSTLREQVQSGAPKGTILNETAKSHLQTIADKLNTQFNGRYLFAGDDTSNAPINNMAALNASMSGLVTGWLAGTPTAGSVVSDAQAVAGTALGYRTSALISGDATMRVDESTDISMTLRAHESGFSDIMRGVAIISNLPQPTTQAETDNYWTVVNGVIDLLERATNTVDQTQGAIGARARIVDDLISQHGETQSTYELFIGDVEDVDAAEAAIKFQALQSQLEMSYSITANLRNLSLVNYI